MQRLVAAMGTAVHRLRLAGHARDVWEGVGGRSGEAGVQVAPARDVAVRCGGAADTQHIWRSMAAVTPPLAAAMAARGGGAAAAARWSSRVAALVAGETRLRQRAACLPVSVCC